ncbi:MAG: hypothetical protein J6R32_00950 [Bacteroidales bacterium]|nr:hypothetical protein [Bacteroidales bacterium]
MNKFKLRKREVEILERIYSILEGEEREAKQEYAFQYKTGNPKTDWRTGEVKTDKDGNIIYEEVWDYQDKEVLSEDDEITLFAIDHIREHIEKML